MAGTRLHAMDHKVNDIGLMGPYGTFKPSDGVEPQRSPKPMDMYKLEVFPDDFNTMP